MEKYNFIKGLNESKMFRTKSIIAKTSSKDMADFAFMNMVALYILSFDPSTQRVIKDYARKTMMYGNFNQYRQSGNDMYQALHSLTRGDHANNINLNQIKIKHFFTNLSRGVTVLNPFSFFMQLERQLNIKSSEYKSIRRMGQDWKHLNDMQKQFVIARLLKYFRSKALRSELYSFIRDMASTQRFLSRNPDSNSTLKGSDSLAKIAAVSAAVAGAAVAGRAFGKSLV